MRVAPVLRTWLMIASFVMASGCGGAGPSASGSVDGALPSRVLMLTTYDLDELVFAALRAGAAGFLLKHAPSDALIDAVRTVARGEGLLAPAVTRRVIEAFANVPVAPGTPHRSWRR